jgi:hypothetical protein
MYKSLVGYSSRKDCLEDLGIDGMMTLKWILGKLDRVWVGLVWFRIITCGGLLAL